ncbi:hypothetical protein MMC16_006892 [Acarospora aff. strigata]|nr:hypothetical protein [Acarospora aff. strigata]
MTFFSSSLDPLFHLLLIVVAISALTSASPAAFPIPPPVPVPGKTLIQPRFNCPSKPRPYGISAHYPDLYAFCSSVTVDCDCYPSQSPISQPPAPNSPPRDRSRDPANSNPDSPPSPGKDTYEVRCRRPVYISSENLLLVAAVNRCRTECMCYGGPEENWSRPHGPGPVTTRPVTTGLDENRMVW